MFSQWCRANYLTVNTSKTKFMLFTPSPNRKQPNKHTAPFSLVLDGVELSFVRVYRYLGVDLDCHLTMESHVERIIGRVRTLLYNVAKLRYYIDQNTSLLMYKTYVLPVLEFGLYLVDKPCLIDRVQKLQNKSLRICLRKPNISPSFPLHSNVNLLSLDLQRHCTLLNFINMKLIRGDNTITWDTRKDNRTQAGGK